ncbi:MAG: hypothetical protein KF830_16115 [Planctomycetes bacterium]|nr:hypothetical protein [Planctomycetota bacterium]
MRRRPTPPLRPALLVAALAGSACSTSGPPAYDLAALLAEAPAGQPARLWLDGDRIVGAAVAVVPGTLPAAARRMADAVAPQGELLFAGREWGPRGDGYRIDKRYRTEDREHDRSVLVTPDGRVLERDHTVPIVDVPQHALAGALTIGTAIEEARIVAGPEREEHWAIVVRDRAGRVFVVAVALDGRVLHARRRLAARLDS